MTLVHTPVLDEAGESQESQEGTDPEEEKQKPPHTTTDTLRTSLRIKVENGKLFFTIKFLFIFLNSLLQN